MTGRARRAERAKRGRGRRLARVTEWANVTAVCGPEKRNEGAGGVDGYQRK